MGDTANNRGTIPGIRGGAVLLALAVGLLLGAPAGAQVRCPANGTKPDTVLLERVGKVVYSRRHGRRDLQRLRARRNGPARVLRGAVPVGLTVAELTFRIRTRVILEPQGRKRYCARLATVETSLGYGDIMVYVAREYRKGSCPYRTILAHENRHVAVFQGTLARFAPRLRTRLREAAGQMAPLWVTDRESPADILQERLRRRLQPLMGEMERVMDKANARIDSPSAYRGEQARCRDW